MTDLNLYREYMEKLAPLCGCDGSLAVTLDDAMARKIQNLNKESTTLFFLPPAIAGEGRSADDYRETEEVVLFVMKRYDPQRTAAFDVLAETQRQVGAIRSRLLADLCGPCAFMELVPASVNILPETKFYAGFAGWSVGFKVVSR